MLLGFRLRSFCCIRSFLSVGATCQLPAVSSSCPVRFSLLSSRFSAIILLFFFFKCRLLAPPVQSRSRFITKVNPSLMYVIQTYLLGLFFGVVFLVDMFVGALRYIQRSAFCVYGNNCLLMVEINYKWSLDRLWVCEF